ncbi:MAG: beta-glucosidase BglX [Candidatus Pseudomonas phytovorans]|uniref:Periplasmic beta-glucosidase n=1 Tax=Candidatus Pseudomonas phytovorans TaxID=3121377 RepID=A0AAJ5WJI5_9PSED|nr:beta-glucosidase BglX [Pseudomonas sp.]WEK29865.1 MAG: beta-glucosidase BglX [Pseudomonas sp.]
MEKRPARLKMTAAWCTAALALLLMACNAAATGGQAARDGFVDRLLTQMTLQEKIGQLRMEYAGAGPNPQAMLDTLANGQVGAMFTAPGASRASLRELQDAATQRSRLHIPLFFAGDVVHGQRTIFPINLGQASSWDLQAVGKSARAAAVEATDAGLDMTFAPMLDISRDPRWGRISEGYGEDTYLVSQFAKTVIHALQGPTLGASDSLMACAKHFAGYGAVEGGRDYNTTDMSGPRLVQDYLPPFKAAVDAGAGAVMTALTSLNGVPATANGWLLHDILRQQWQFKGLVISDHGAVEELITHGIAEDGKQAAQAALKAGTQLSMSDRYFARDLQRLVMQGQVTERELDNAVRQVLATKYDLGLFDDPYRRLRATSDNEDQRLHRAQARDMARRSLVLLKNHQQTLPLSRHATIALIGPLADNAVDILGSWHGNGKPEQAVTLRQGLQSGQAVNARLLYAKGANISDNPQAFALLGDKQVNFDPRRAESMLAEAVAAARQADVVVVALGEARGMSHEGASRTELNLPEQQRALLRSLKATGKPLVLVLMNGRPLTISEESQWADAVLETWFSGSEGGNAIADVLYGEYNPSGKLPVTFARSVGQIPLYYNHLNTGRPFDPLKPVAYRSRYYDIDDTPLYPFGYGLSYTHFSVSAPRLSSARLLQGQSLQVQVTVRNEGLRAGETVVQLYIRDRSASVSRPVKELKGFKKLYLAPGQTQEVTLHLPPSALSFVDRELRWVTEPGWFDVMVGLDSQAVQTASFELMP